MLMGAITPTGNCATIGFRRSATRATGERTQITPTGPREHHTRAKPMKITGHPSHPVLTALTLGMIFQRESLTGDLPIQRGTKS